MILRKKAISVKEHIDSQGNYPNEAPSVYYVTLTSCDKYGKPDFPVSFFDGATKRSFKKHDIRVITVHDLVIDFKEACPDWDGKSDNFPRCSTTQNEKKQRLRKSFEDCYKKLLAKKVNMDEFTQMLVQNGINVQNAVQEVIRRKRDLNFEVSLLDVYIMLYAFIKRHRKDHIFVDELSILHSKFCKLYLL